MLFAQKCQNAQIGMQINGNTDEEKTMVFVFSLHLCDTLWIIKA